MRVSVIGLGKLGACLATCFAHRGVATIAVDLNGDTVAKLNRGIAPVTEPGLQELISKNGHNLRATTRHEEAIRNSDVSFIVVPTPARRTANSHCVSCATH
jgi:UDPglucose 6-dehydrogenase